MGIMADRLKAARASKGLSQIEVRNLTSINNKTLSGYENSVSEPDYATLVSLANLYNVSLDYLLGRVANPHDELVMETTKPLPTDAKIIGSASSNPERLPPEQDADKIGERVSTVSLSRSDNPDADLPEEAQKQIEEFRAYIRQKYKKPE